MSKRAIALVAVGMGLCLSGCAAERSAAAQFKSSMVSVNGCRMTERDGAVVLSSPAEDDSFFQTRRKFRPPFVVRMRATTDSTNLRLYYSAGMVIFNWEVNRTELRVHDPATGRITALRGRGHISPNVWHDIVWTVEPDWMTISVDGDVRYGGAGDYAGVEAPVGIGCAFGSKVSAESFAITRRRQGTP